MSKSFGLTAVVLGSIAALTVAAAQEMPKPGPEHEAMGIFAGEWSFEGEMAEGPMGPGGKATFTETCEWFDGKFAIVCRSQGKGPRGPAKSLSIMSYDAEKKAYTYYAVETGMPPFMATGEYDGKAWRWRSESKMGGQTLETRVTLTETSPASYDFEMKVSTDGTNWMPVMEGKYVKTSS